MEKINWFIRVAAIISRFKFPSYAQNESNKLHIDEKEISQLHIDGAANVEMASWRTSKRISSKADHKGVI